MQTETNANAAVTPDTINTPAAILAAGLTRGDVREIRRALRRGKSQYRSQDDRLTYRFWVLADRLTPSDIDVLVWRRANRARLGRNATRFMSWRGGIKALKVP